MFTDASDNLDHYRIFHTMKCDLKINKAAIPTYGYNATPLNQYIPNKASLFFLLRNVPLLNIPDIYYEFNRVSSQHNVSCLFS